MGCSYNLIPTATTLAAAECKGSTEEHTGKEQVRIFSVLERVLTIFTIMTILVSLKAIEVKRNPRCQINNKQNKAQLTNKQISIKNMWVKAVNKDLAEAAEC